MKFKDQYADQREVANSTGDLIRICNWGGGGAQYLWVLNLETDEYIHCEGCADRTPFYLSTGESDPVFVCSDECAARVGHLKGS
jgi:hypothetical protein